MNGPVGYEYGAVTVVAPLTVLLDSEATAVVTALAVPVSFVVGDRVLVLVQGADRVVVGNLNPKDWVTSFVPQIDQGATTNIAKTVTKCQWRYDGSMVEFEFFLALTGAGTAGSAVTITLPVTALSTTNGAMGSAFVYDSSTATYYLAAASTASTTQINFLNDGPNGLWGIFPNLALANGDQIRGLIRYRWV